MIIEQQITDRIKQAFNPEYLAVVNESHMHSVPENSETHFKVVAVAEVFANKRAVQRHLAVYALLPDLMRNPIHALALQLYSPEEWSKNTEVRESPNCMGGSKAG